MEFYIMIIERLYYRMAFDIQNRRYTGSKAKIADWIDSIICDNCRCSTSFFDVFAGTGIVTATELDRFNTFYINDFLYSNNIIFKAYFLNSFYRENLINQKFIEYYSLDPDSLGDNYVSKNYGNKYFSIGDSKKIGFIREDIEKNRKFLNEKEYAILLASLLYSLDRCANTCGHYDAFFQNRTITDSFSYELIRPINTEGKTINIFREDSNILAKKIQADVAYVDPPYSSRQYSRFYHVLENITKWDKPQLFGTAMKPAPENMSVYCKNKAFDFFSALIFNLNVKYLVVSYNNTYNSRSSSSKNKMELDEIKTLLEKRGSTKVFCKNYQAFNAGKTEISDHKEYIFFTEVNK